VVPDFATHCSTKLISAMQGSGGHSWSEPHFAAPICVVPIYAWQSSTALALVAMREQHQAAIPIGRHIDQVVGIAQHALIPPGRLGGVRDPEPQSQDQGRRNRDPRRHPLMLGLQIVPRPLGKFHFARTHPVQRRP
jgi:hypothetical protein